MVRYGSTVYRHKWSRGVGTIVMNRSSHHFFSGSTFPGNQHSGFIVFGSFYGFVQQLPGLRNTNDSKERFYFLFRKFILNRCGNFFCNDMIQGRIQFFIGKRFNQIFYCSHFHHIYRSLHIGKTRYDQNWRLCKVVRNVFDKLGAAYFWHV